MIKKYQQILVSALLFATPLIAFAQGAPLQPLKTSTLGGTSAPAKPLIGAFRWDAWFPDNVSVLSRFFVANLYTDWSSRQPSYGWFDANVPNQQAIMDQEINDAADHGLDFWAFDDYSMMQDIPAGSRNTSSLLYGAFQEYMASSYKARLKFALATGGGCAASACGYIPGYFRSTYIPRLAKLFQDPQYLKVDGNRPVLFWSDDSSSWANFPNWHEDRAYLNQLAEAAGLGDPIFINTTMDIAAAKAHGLDGMTTYGVQGNGAKPDSGCTTDTSSGSAVYHCPFSAQIAKDEANWNTAAQSGLLAVPGLTPVDDPRAIPHPYGFWVDQPTYTQWEEEVKDAFAFIANNASKTTNPPIAVIYAWNELAEGGPGIIPTKQNGTMYLDAIAAVKTGNYPSAYQDAYGGDNDAIRLAAGAGNPSHWVDYSPLAGNFNNAEETSQGTGESATLIVDNTTGFEVKGTEGPDRGRMQVFIDDASQGVVNLYSSIWLRHQSLFKNSPLPAGTHTLRLLNVSDDVTHAKMGIDEIIVAIRRSAAVASQSTAPDKPPSASNTHAASPIAR